MLELHVAETEVQSGSVRIRWCVDKETLRILDQLGCHEPRLLLVTAKKGRRFSGNETRKIVPLRDLMTYVDFRSPGENVVHGFILYKDTEKEQKAEFLRRRHGSWNTDVLDSDGDPYDDCVRFRLPGDETAEGRSAALDVTVPAECFAKEPPKWEKEWVNWWFRSQPADQCAYRKRRLLAYTVQPIVALALIALIGGIAYGLAWTVGILLTLCGVRGFDYRLFYWPFYAVEDNGDRVDLGDLDGSWFLPRTKRAWVRFITFPFTPIFPLAAFVILKFAVKMRLGAAVGLSFLGAFGIAALVAVMGLLITMIWTAVEISMRASAEAERERLKNQPHWYLDDPLLACDGGGKPMSVRDLPRRRRTIRLRFLDLKAKVCRPFAS